MSSTFIHTNDSPYAADGDESRLLMAELSIAHAGRYYQDDAYRYERLEDAVAYAQLVRARPSAQRDSSTFAQVDAIESPNAVERALMLELSISFENGCFVFEGFHYDTLIDAANCARHRRQLVHKACSSRSGPSPWGPA